MFYFKKISTKKLISIIFIALPYNSFADLRVVEQLQNQLATQPVIVIFGAPGSGKTEQMELGLAGQPYTVFDLRNQFLEYYYEKEKITNLQEKEAIKKKYRMLKDEEFQWLSQNKNQIINNLKVPSSNIIVFDEFDLGDTFKSGTPELKSAKIVFDIAALLKNKKILIIHNAVLNSPELMHALKQQFGIDETKIVRTSYLTPAEEQGLLATTPLTEKERAEFMIWAEGNPTAYLPLISSLARKEMNKFGFNELKRMAILNVKKNYVVARNSNPTVAQAIQQVASGQTSLNAYDNGIKEGMRNTGLVGLRSGSYIMPPLVKDAIKDF